LPTISAACRSTSRGYIRATPEHAAAGRFLQRAAHTSHAVLGTYGSSKFCVRALTHVMAQEFAAHGITVNSYCPGIVDTGMWDTIDSRAAEVLGIPEGAMKQKALEGIVLGWLQTPEDVANFVSFFASRDADYVTGQNMLTDGGMVMI